MPDRSSLLFVPGKRHVALEGTTESVTKRLERPTSIVEFHWLLRPSESVARATSSATSSGTTPHFSPSDHL
jgi:hypothetical protein